MASMSVIEPIASPDSESTPSAMAGRSDPAILARPAEIVLAQACGPRAKSKGRVLVVDDEEVVRAMATDMLEMLGYDVMTARDGQEAAELYERHFESIDLVVLDMIMPRMGGRECFVRIKATNPAVKSILCTGYSRNGEAQEILNLGVLGFIQKPFLMHQFASAIDEIISI